MTHAQHEIDAMAQALRAQGLTWSQTNFAVSLVRNAAAAERERMCVAIKAADDKASEGDYMLDSDDCISVIRGTRALGHNG